MDRNQWYWLFIKHHVVQDEIERICGLILTSGPVDDDEFLVGLLEGLVQCCANVASRIDNQPQTH